MDDNADLLAAALDDDATAELLNDAPAAVDPDPPAPQPAHARSALPATARITPKPPSIVAALAPAPAPTREPAEAAAPKVLEAAPGVVLRQRYVLEKPLAAGGTAIIYRACDLRRDGGLVALKILRPERRDRPQAVESLRREFQYAQTLSHPNIARVFDLDCDRGLWFLTLELLEGESLAAHVRRAEEPVSSRRALDVLCACGEALAFAHERGVVHGDFKPGNVFITRSGQVRVLDFGAAAASWRPAEARAAAATPPYASPQVLMGERPERRDDVFSFACVAYELLSGHHPFGRRSSLEARAARAELARAWNLSPRQWHALEGALSWEREQRPATLRALLSELTSAEVAPPLVIPEISAEAQTFRTPALTPILLGLVLAVLGTIGLVIAYSWLRDGQDAERAAAAATSAFATRSPVAPPGAAPTKAVTQAPAPARKSAPPPPAKPNVRPGTAPAADVAAATVPIAAVERRWASQPAQVSFEAPTLLVSESAVAAVLRLDRSQQVDGRVRVNWRTQGGTASPGRDFSPVTGVAEFSEGQTMRAIYIPLLNDRLAERDETFTVELFESGDGTRIHPTASVQATIRDDDR